jgi:hypothetical protein
MSSVLDTFQWGTLPFRFALARKRASPNLSSLARTYETRRGDANPTIEEFICDLT